VASVYTICLWYKYTTRFPHNMFRPDRGHLQVHWGLYNLLFPSATLPTLASVHTLGVRGMYGFCLPPFWGWGIYYLWDIENIKILNFYIKTRVKIFKILNT
jgi:hypothetical protein